MRILPRAKLQQETLADEPHRREPEMPKTRKPDIALGDIGLVGRERFGLHQVRRWRAEVIIRKPRTMLLLDGERRQILVDLGDDGWRRGDRPILMKRILRPPPEL